MQINNSCHFISRGSYFMVHIDLKCQIACGNKLKMRKTTKKNQLLNIMYRTEQL